MINPNLTILQGDVIEQLRTLSDESVQCCVTSPPYYGLRSYLGADDPAKALEIGAEETPQAYVDRMVAVFREVRRVLRADGVLWLNLGDSFARAGGTDRKPSATAQVGNTQRTLNQMVSRNQRVPDGVKIKDLLMIPSRVAMALQADGWYLRASCPWIKRNAMPESVRDRPATTIETIFLLAKGPRYYYDAEAVKVTSSANPISAARRNRQDFGSVGTEGLKGDGRFGQSGQGENAKYKTPTRTRRSSDWFFESWQGMLQDEEGDPLAFVVNTKPYRAAHFATFPVDLVEPMVKAGTSAHGCCPECGAPFRRVFERTAEVNPSAKGSRFDAGKTGDRDGGERTQQGERYLTRAVGWKQDCDCATYTPVPCTVLDPFGGSGTTGQVALEQGCRAILIELNAAYIPLIQQRCGVQPEAEKAA